MKGDSDKDISNLLLRLHNTEVALISMWSLIKDSIAIHAADAVEEMMEDYFYHQEKLGAFKYDQFFKSDHTDDEIRYSVEFDKAEGVKVSDKTSDLSIREALELMDKMNSTPGLNNISLKTI